MEIKYRNGVPTQKSIYELIRSFDERLSSHLYVDNNYGKKGNEKYNKLIWQDKYCQSRIDDFIGYAREHGVFFGKYNPYESPMVGHLYILPNSLRAKIKIRHGN